MTRLASWALLTLVTVLVIGTPGPASPAAGDPQLTVKVDRHTLHSGQALTATASARVVCDWIVEWNGERRHVRARTFTTTFTAPQVSRRTRMPLAGTCVVAPAGAAPARSGTARTATAPDRQPVVVRIPPHASHVVPVTVVPGGGAVSPPETGAGVGGEGTGSGGLPGTGGPPSWLLVAGVGALAIGALVVRRAQRAPIASRIP